MSVPDGAATASRRKREPPLVAAHGRAPRVAVAVGPEAVRDARRRGDVSPGRVSVAWIGREPSRRLQIDEHPGSEHAEGGQALELPERRAALEAIERAGHAVGTRVERGVDAPEERRAQRRVGRDVGRHEAGGGDHRQHDQQARAQRHPAQRRSDAPAAAAAGRH